MVFTSLWHHRRAADSAMLVRPAATLRLHALVVPTLVFDLSSVFEYTLSVLLAGYYSCLCPSGHYGRGLQGDCHSESYSIKVFPYGRNRVTPKSRVSCWNVQACCFSWRPEILPSMPRRAPSVPTWQPFQVSVPHSRTETQLPFEQICL